MPGKEHRGGSSRGGNDILGVVLICLGLLLFAALFSYDRHDLPANYLSTNAESSLIQNWTGKFGAQVGHKLFLSFGAGAFLLPVFFLGFGLANFVVLLGYLRSRWPWAIVLLLTCSAALDLGTDRAAFADLARNGPSAEAGFLERLTLNISAPSAGGVVGLNLNRFIFGYFGRVGSVILFATLWVIGLYGLTNFHLGDWVRALIQQRREQNADMFSGEDETLERRARQLEKEAKRLKQELTKATRAPAKAPPPTPSQEPIPGLGADMQPLPEPTVRDLSMPRVRSEAPAVEPEAIPADQATDPLERVSEGVGEPRPAVDVSPASTEDILDRPMPAAPDGDSEAAEVSAPEESEEPVAEREETEETSTEEPPAPPPPTPPPRSRPAQRRPKPITVATPPVIGDYRVPSIDLLQYPDTAVRPSESKEELVGNARLMQQTLAQFGIQVAVGDITKGPTITRYELHPAPGVKLEKIASLANNITAALKAERINILAPVPGRSSVGVEIPNRIKSKVIMRELLEAGEWRNSRGRVPLALGKDVYGHPIVADLAEMPHLLIAGSTGSGKSVCINSIVASLLFKFSPDQLRFVMIDPKVVELQHYNALPHLVVPVVTDPKKVVLALRWVVSEMEKRYQIFARVGVRNIKSFNDRSRSEPLPDPEPELPLTARGEKVEAGAEGFAVEVDEEIVVPREDDIIIPEKLSYIVVIIDELADLMLVAPSDVEMAIARITQMARAAGIHCIVATQRPSVDVITGVIKANIPARIAFQVASKVDSRTILDQMGADKLLGKGDMLYLPPGSGKTIRAQGALITDEEIESMVDFIAQQGKPNYDMEIHKQLSKPSSPLDSNGGIDEDEDLIQQCIEVIRTEAKASVSLMQRRLRLGYTRAARIMDELENRGIVGPSKGAEPREILIDLDGGGADGSEADSAGLAS